LSVGEARGALIANLMLATDKPALAKLITGAFK
jgi:hypothetical protein